VFWPANQDEGGTEWYRIWLPNQGKIEQVN
jgi:hypothetical protein